MPNHLVRLFSTRVRSRRDLLAYVARTTVLCVIAALSLDIGNQLIFFIDWPVAVRSWLVTAGVAAVIAAPVSRAIGAAHLALYRGSQIDGLTGLLNRKALLEQENGEPSAMVLIIADIDRFKAVNDTHGHLAGDAVLVAIAQEMARSLGPYGRVGRLGGEEFALLADIETLDPLSAELEAMRSRIADTALRCGTELVRVTISAGIARREPSEPFEQLYARADRALYMAKTSGRNRIVSADDLRDWLPRATEDLRPSQPPVAERSAAPAAVASG